MAETGLLPVLKTMAFFNGLSELEIEEVLSQSRLVEFDEGHAIVEEGGGFVGFHLILDGTVIVSEASHPIATLGPGEYFGEISAIDGKPRTATVTTASHVRTLSLPASGFLSLLEAHPKISRKIVLGLCGRMRDANTPVS